MYRSTELNFWFWKSDDEFWNWERKQIDNGDNGHATAEVTVVVIIIKYTPIKLL